MTDDRDYLVCCRVKFPISKICWVFFVGHLGLFQTATKPKPFLSLPTGVKPNISHRLYNPIELLWTAKKYCKYQIRNYKVRIQITCATVERGEN